MIIDVYFLPEEGESEGEDEFALIQIGKKIRIEDVRISEDGFFLKMSNGIEDGPNGRKRLTGRGEVEIRVKGKVPEWKEA